MMMAPSTASQKNSSMVKLSPSGSAIHSVSWSMNALTMKVNSPSVRMMTGKLRNFAIGLTTALTSPKTSATSSTVANLEPNLPSPKLIPGSNQAATHSATALTATLMTKFMVPIVPDDQTAILRPRT